MIDFKGVVEDNNDPLKLGRVRVRIVGIHTDNKQLIPTEKLPWALVAQATDSSPNSGKGKSSTILKGTLVLGKFLDEQKQDPVVTHTLPGIVAEQPNVENGFCDPDGVYPHADKLNEPDTNRLARNEKIEETIVQAKKDGIDKDVTSGSGEKWSEPETPYAAMYPFNTVVESHAGHIMEVDDTEGAERIHVYHKSGSFVEMHPDGTVVTKNVKDNIHIIAGNNNVHVKQAYNITVDGDAYIKSKNAVLDCERVDVGKDADSPIALGDKLLEALNKFLESEYATHQHPTAVGPSGPPMKPATKLMDTLLSKLGFIKA